MRCPLQAAHLTKSHSSACSNSHFSLQRHRLGDLDDDGADELIARVSRGVSPTSSMRRSASGSQCSRLLQAARSGCPCRTQADGIFLNTARRSGSSRSTARRAANCWVRSAAGIVVFRFRDILVPFFFHCQVARGSIELISERYSDPIAEMLAVVGELRSMNECRRAAHANLHDVSRSA